MDKAIQTMRDNYKDYRRLMEVRAERGEDGALLISGTPVIFEQPYKLFRYGKKDVYEVIERGAFDEADMKDVPLKYNHADNRGTPARTTAKGEVGRMTLTLTDTALEMKANLLPTSGGKDLYTEIEAGTVSQMSWAFTEAEDGETYEERDDEITIRVRKIARVFDVSAVDFGANPNTSIYARRLGDLDERRAALDERARAEAILRIKNKVRFLT